MGTRHPCTRGSPTSMNLNVNVNLELRQSHAQLHMHHRLTRYIIIATIYKPSHRVKQELTRRWDTRTWRDVSSYMVTYLPLNYDTPVLRNIFEVTRTYVMDVCFRKAPFRILLLSTVRVYRINCYLVCTLSIHTRSSANAERPRARCQLKSCKMLHKCSTDCTWKDLQPVNDLQRIQGHCRCCHLIGHIRFRISLPL